MNSSTHSRPSIMYCNLRHTAASGIRPYSVRRVALSVIGTADSAMAKLPACAAASSSSGLVPLRPSASANRIFVEDGCSANTPLGVVKLPAPSDTVPCQTAFALRRIDHFC